MAFGDRVCSIQAVRVVHRMKYPGGVMKIRRLVAITFVVAGLSGCTTIVDHMVDNINDVIGVKSTKEQQSSSKGHVSANAQVNVVVHGEKHVSESAVPAKISLKNQSSSGWVVTNYTIRISLPKYYASNITLKKTSDGWHVSNYLGLGKVIGWIIINPANGGVYTLSPDQLPTPPSRKRAVQVANHISILTIDSVPKSLQSKMTLVEYLSPKKSSSVANGRK